VKDPAMAESLRAKAMANPADFGNLAKQHSEDPSASVKGIINPIRRHGSYEQIEKAVFNMKDGSISPVIEARGQYLIFQRIASTPPQNVDFDEAAPRLRAFLRDRKTQRDGGEVFKELQERAVKQKAVQIVFNDPAARQKWPGVAALVYDTEISMRELADDCLARHGQEVLDGVIGHKVVELECRKRGIAITEKDIDREIARAAMMGVTAKKDGSPDVDAWLKLIRKRGISLDVYRHDLVWTSVALKRLVGDKIEVTDDDLKKGYEANYGERVRCLAIVLNEQRRAQQVWEMARKNNTSEYFGKLAGQYSVEPGSQSLAGEVPPIRKYGGQKLLEDEAFQLKPGELSGVIQVGDKFIILRCEGRTKPLGFKFAEVRDEIYQELHEKKLQIAMQERFDALQEAATIDNYLAGTSHSPKPTIMSPTARRPNPQRTPTQ
jgi:parvulin-like peptidyl-prolyl isomerase